MMMSLDLGNTLIVLTSIALATAPVVVRSLNRIAHLTGEEMRVKERIQQESKKP